MWDQLHPQNPTHCNLKNMIFVDEDNFNSWKKYKIGIFHFLLRVFIHRIKIIFLLFHPILTGPPDLTPQPKPSPQRRCTVSPNLINFHSFEIKLVNQLVWNY